MARAKQIRDLSKSLEMDLAVSRVRLAAMKAKAGLDVDEAEVNSATLLLSFLRRLHAANLPYDPLSAELVPQENMRTVLQENLATFAPRRPEVNIDVANIPMMMESLGTIETGSLSAEQANHLLLLLDRMSYRPTVPTLLPDPAAFTDPNHV